MTRDAVTSDQLPPSGLPFSVAVRGGGLLFLSGQVAQNPDTGELTDGDVAQQADQILRNIAATLAAIGKDLDDVIRVGVYLTDMSKFGAMNEVYRRHFGEPYPARTAIGVAALPLGAAVEMDTAQQPSAPAPGSRRCRSSSTATAATAGAAASSWRSGRALRGIETHRDPDAHHGQPRPSSHQPDQTLPGPTPFSYAGTDDRRGTDPTLDPQ